MPSLASPDVVVRARSLDVTFGSSRVVHGVNLDVTRGEAVALLGANGSGKSTLVRTLVHILSPSAGTVELFGAPLGRSTPWHRLGYVPQRVADRSGVAASAREVVASGLLSGSRLLRPRNWRERTAQALAQVDMSEHEERSMAVLSGGQQQRVLIARALVREPELLILDEPVAGVDHASQEAFARTLARLHDRGVTIIVVLHELAELRGLITRAVVLEHGRIAADGPPAPPGSPAGAHDRWAGHPHDDAAAPSTLSGPLPAHVPAPVPAHASEPEGLRR